VLKYTLNKLLKTLVAVVLLLNIWHVTSLIKFGSFKLFKLFERLHVLNNTRDYLNNTKFEKFTAIF